MGTRCDQPGTNLSVQRTARGQGTRDCVLELSGKLIKPNAVKILMVSILRQMPVDGIYGLAPVMRRPAQTDVFWHFYYQSPISLEHNPKTV